MGTAAGRTARKLALSVAAVMAGATLPGFTQPLAPVKVCQPNDTWFYCADKVKKAIKSTNATSTLSAASSCHAIV